MPATMPVWLSERFSRAEACGEGFIVDADELIRADVSANAESGVMARNEIETSPGNGHCGEITREAKSSTRLVLNRRVYKRMIL
ncbi:hypothetical protein Zmor_008471 [Zophobas morio]|uniref:Uncharacterized protein n=1 Tax=Zophobas morio TaxID=2755281 RepID=A0AA38J499_9CUCU|nr:hypothetical protein Zmor_008471 [Zophobas morio]